MHGSSTATGVGTNLPAIGSVHGFLFKFGTQNLQYPHPGLVISAREGMKGSQIKVGVMALAISHSQQGVNWDSPDTVIIPPKERDLMGLDSKEQWVLLFEQVVAYFPGDVRRIASLDGSHLGQASPEFTRQVVEEWNIYRKRLR